MMSEARVKDISECFIKPKYEVEEAKNPFYLAPMDLAMLSAHYIQKGLLFLKPSSTSDDPQTHFYTLEFLEDLKDSLAETLVYFYPLAGQLATRVDESRHESLVFVDGNKGPGARFVHARLDKAVSDILDATDVPAVVQSFFDHDRAVNHDGHHISLLTIQVTELHDGIFIGCSMNHALGDGTSYWMFWNAWSHIHLAKTHGRDPDSIITSSHMPNHNRWFPDGYDPPTLLPFTQTDEFISRYEAPELRERIFHFSPESMAKLKARANNESKQSNFTISSFQALSALCWRSITRAVGIPDNQVTNCRLAANNRHRLDPPLSKNYFGNCISAVPTSTTMSELHQNSLGWAATLLNQSVANHNDESLQEFMKQWRKSPIVYQLGQMFDPYSVMMGSSPRFDMYGNQFGIGKAVAIRSGYAHKFTGKVTSYEGYEGGGSVDLEICLPPYAMEALESDQEFFNSVSSLHVNEGERDEDSLY